MPPQPPNPSNPTTARTFFTRSSSLSSNPSSSNGPSWAWFLEWWLTEASWKKRVLGVQTLQPSGMEAPPAGPESKQWNLHSFLVLHLLGEEFLDLPHRLGLLCFLRCSYESLYFWFHGIRQIHDFPFHVLHLGPPTKIWNPLWVQNLRKKLEWGARWSFM